MARFLRRLPPNCAAYIFTYFYLFLSNFSDIKFHCGGGDCGGCGGCGG